MVYVGVAVDQHAYYSQALLFARISQRRPAIVVFGFNVCSVLNQKPDNVNVALFAGDGQCRTAVEQVFHVCVCVEHSSNGIKLAGARCAPHTLGLLGRLFLHHDLVRLRLSFCIGMPNAQAARNRGKTAGAECASEIQTLALLLCV